MEELGKVILKLASEIKNGQWKLHLTQEALATNKDVQGFVKEMYETKEELKENPTAYFYDLTVIRENIRRLQEDLPPQTKLYYSMKANPHDKEIRRNYIRANRKFAPR